MVFEPCRPPLPVPRWASRFSSWSPAATSWRAMPPLGSCSARPPPGRWAPGRSRPLPARVGEPALRQRVVSQLEQAASRPIRRVPVFLAQLAHVLSDLEDRVERQGCGSGSVASRCANGVVQDRLSCHAQAEAGTSAGELEIDLCEGLGEAPRREAGVPGERGRDLELPRVDGPAGATFATAKPLSAINSFATLASTRKSPAAAEPSRKRVG